MVLRLHRASTWRRVFLRFMQGQETCLDRSRRVSLPKISVGNDRHAAATDADWVGGRLACRGNVRGCVNHPSELTPPSNLGGRVLVFLLRRRRGTGCWRGVDNLGRLGRRAGATRRNHDDVVGDGRVDGSAGPQLEHGAVAGLLRRDGEEVFFVTCVGSARVEETRSVWVEAACRPLDPVHVRGRWGI